jgi:hypothetical protein
MRLKWEVNNVPRGRKKKWNADDVKAETVSDATTEVIEKDVAEEENEQTKVVLDTNSREARIKEAGELGAGQKYFEAPDGTIIIGESSRGRVFYRKENIWIRPMR